MSTKMTDIAGVFKHVKVNNVHMLKYAYFAEIDKTNLKLYTFPAANTLGSQKNYSFISSNDKPSEYNVTINSTSSSYWCKDVKFYGFENYTFKPTTFDDNNILTPGTHAINTANNIIRSMQHLYFQFIIKCDLSDTENEYIAMYFPTIEKLFHNEIMPVTSCDLRNVGNNTHVTTTLRFALDIENTWQMFDLPLIALVKRLNDNEFTNSDKEFLLQDIAMICYGTT